MDITDFRISGWDILACNLEIVSSWTKIRQILKFAQPFLPCWVDFFVLLCKIKQCQKSFSLLKATVLPKKAFKLHPKHFDSMQNFLCNTYFIKNSCKNKSSKLWTLGRIFLMHLNLSKKFPLHHLLHLFWIEKNWIIFSRQIINDMLIFSGVKTV